MQRARCKWQCHVWVVVVALAGAPCVNAASNAWSALGPEGGDVREVAMHPVNPDIAVAIAISGVYRTTNGGVSWSRSNYTFQNAPYDLQVDPSDPERLYVFSFSNPHIAVSTDGGVSFQALTLPMTNAYEPRLALGAGGVVFTTAGLRVFRSENRGVSWVERGAIVQPGDMRIGSIVADPADANTVYATVTSASAPLTGATFISRDGAATWTQLSGPAIGIVPHPTRSGELWSPRTDGLWRSMDFGATWSLIHFTQLISDVALNQRGADLEVIVSTYPGLFRSTNGGASWTDISGDNLSFPNRVVAHPLHADRIMVYGYAGIRVAGAAPGTWITRQAGIVATSVGSFHADASTDRIYATSNGIHVSSGSGNFVQVNDRPLATMGTPPLPKLVTAIHAQAGTLLALLSDELARSTDGGASWELVPGSRLPYQSWDLKGAANDPANLIVDGNPTIYRSMNGGTSWTPVSAGLPANASAFDFEFAPSNASILYLSPFISQIGAPQTFGVYRSTDGGFNWAPANKGIETLGVYDIAVDPTNAQTVYSIAGSTLIKSTDGGESWRTLLHSIRSGGRIAIDPVHPRIVYVAHSENDLLRSVNGGESFEILRHTGMNPMWYMRDVIVDPRRPSVLNLGTGGFGVQQMSIEPDLELKWGEAPVPPAVGAPVSYSLFVTNRGPYASSGARVTLQLPSEMSEVAAATQNGACTVQQTDVSCVLESLALNASAGITLSMKSQAEGSWSVVAQVQGEQPDAVATNNSQALALLVLSVGLAPQPPAPPSTANPAPTPPATPAPTTSSAPQSGGGGGGGSMSLLLCVVSAGFAAARSRPRTRRV